MIAHNSKTITGMVKTWWYKPALFLGSIINHFDKRPATHFWIALKIAKYCYKEKIILVEDG